MDSVISVRFGIPEHGWLPVNFYYNEFHLDFAASDVLNDPIEELYNAVTKLQDKEHRGTIWWLEPAAYFFDFERNGQSIILTINETEDLHNETAEKRQLIRIKGDNKSIVEPFRAAIKQLYSQTYEENHWPYKLDKDKVNSL